jgi:hypothetical protein
MVASDPGPVGGKPVTAKYPIASSATAATPSKAFLLAML